MGLKHGITKGDPNNIPAENQLEILIGAPPFLIPTQHWLQLKTFFEIPGFPNKGYITKILDLEISIHKLDFNSVTSVAWWWVTSCHR
jgi:hypothetical protein